MHDLGMFGKPIDATKNSLFPDPTCNMLSIEMGLAEQKSADESKRAAPMLRDLTLTYS